MTMLTEVNARLLRLEYLASRVHRRLACASDIAPCRTPGCDGANGRQFDASVGELHTRLHSIRHALERLDCGVGDLCECCGRPIDAARLFELPDATRCEVCA